MRLFQPSRLCQRGAFPVRARSVEEQFLTASNQQLAQCISTGSPEPVVFRCQNQWKPHIEQLYSAMKREPDEMVEIEHGRMDQREYFEKVSIPLSSYIDWLKSGSTQVGNRPFYLAQSSLWGSRLKDLHPAPPALELLTASKKVDLYQASLFLGPSGSITPLHFDPTANVFQIIATSEPEACKVLLLLPPKLTPLLERKSRSNMCKYTLKIGESGLVEMDPGTKVPANLEDAIKQEAIFAKLHQGDIIYIPNRYWHQVETPFMDGSTVVAALGWWHAKRG